MSVSARSEKTVRQADAKAQLKPLKEWFFEKVGEGERPKKNNQQAQLVECNVPDGRRLFLFTWIRTGNGIFSSRPIVSFCYMLAGTA